MSWKDFADLALVRLEWAILVYFVLVNSFYGLLLISAARELITHMLSVRGESRQRILGAVAAPKISILAPAYNEEATIEDSIGSLLALFYPNLEVIVVNDGSKDATIAVMRRAFDLVPIHTVYEERIETQPVRGIYRSRSHASLVVVDKQNGGKADALNAALNFASGDLVCSIDADTLIEPDALQRMVRPFLTRDDVVAAGGTVRVANGSTIRDGRILDMRCPRHPIAGFQVVEYLRAFLFGRLGWNRLGGNLIISGAFGLFRRDSVLAIGGYARDTVGEDMELVLRLRRKGYEKGGPSEAGFVPDPVAWTEVPESARVLGRQRDRWHRGLADVLVRHRGMFLSETYGAMGSVGYPYFLFVELMAPVVEMTGLIGAIVGLIIGAINVPFAILFFLLAYGYGIILSVFTLLMEELSYHRYKRIRDIVRLLGWVFLENLGYRQLTVIWRLRGIVKYLMGRKDWGKMERRGLSRAPAA